jgi:hypothetical protein
MRHPAKAPGARAVVPRTAPWGTQWGQLDRAQGTCRSSGSGDLGCGSLSGDPPRTLLCRPLCGRLAGASRGDRLKIVTWLILPVVICLSQRLSHACLSISNLYSETANGSLNQLSFI